MKGTVSALSPDFCLCLALYLSSHGPADRGGPSDSLSLPSSAASWGWVSPNAPAMPHSSSHFLLWDIRIRTYICIRTHTHICVFMQVYIIIPMQAYNFCSSLLLVYISSAIPTASQDFRELSREQRKVYLRLLVCEPEWAAAETDPCTGRERGGLLNTWCTERPEVLS